MKRKAYKGMKKVDRRWGHYVERGGRFLWPRNCSKHCEKSSVRFCPTITEETQQVLGHFGLGRAYSIREFIS